MKKKKRVRKEPKRKRKCQPAVITSCTFWLCSGRLSFLSFLLPVSIYQQNFHCARKLSGIGWIVNRSLRNFHFLGYYCSRNLCFRQNSLDPTKVSSAMKISLDYNSHYTSELLHFIIILVMLACRCQIVIVITA